jgi:hypothetical protein
VNFDFEPPCQWDRAAAVLNEIYSINCGGVVLNAARRDWMDTWEDGGFNVANRLPLWMIERKLEYGRDHARLLESVRKVADRVYAEQADSVNWWAD